MAVLSARVDGGIKKAFACLRGHSAPATRYPAAARIQALDDTLDDAALACRIASFEQDHDLVVGQWR